jgi:alkaline phosphatase D
MRPVARREFLRLTIVTATAIFPNIACSGDDADSTVLQNGERFFPQSVASGDPRPNSVVLWARLEDPERVGSDLSVDLQVAKDKEFTQLVQLGGAPRMSTKAEAKSAHCVKVRVDNLEPGTTYYYRFIYRRDSQSFLSRVGRTKTAPANDADVSVTFAVVACQDFGGKYFHVYRHLAEQNLDFFVHLGDYIYETAGDPSFQAASESRKVTFREPGAAIALADTDVTYYAANSLENYRDLYRTYRSDPDLQRAHELFPMVAVWDDHEFSDDCYGDTSNYSSGRSDEKNPVRRANADQAWFEFMPIDYVGPASAYDVAKSFPDNFSIYRALEFGKHMHLVMTDLRRYRADHVIAENAFPGAVALTQTELQAELGALPDDSVAYVDIDAFEAGRYRDFLRANLQGFTPQRITGLISAVWINARLTELAALPGVPPAIDVARSDLQRGYAYHQLLKSAEYTRMGARYLLRHNVFRAIANARFKATNGESEQAMGAAQERWFLDTLQGSTKTWKIWGNEFTFMQRAIDLSKLTVGPEELHTKLLVTCEDWDGFPNRREALLNQIATKNVVAVTGDLHAFFAGTPHSESDPEKRIVEFVVGSVTSTTWQSGLSSAVKSDPNLPPEAVALASVVGELLQAENTRPNPHIGYLDLARNGYAVLSVDAEFCNTTLFMITDTKIQQPTLDGVLADHFEARKFRVPSGTAALYQYLDGSWKRWSMDSFKWLDA